MKTRSHAAGLAALALLTPLDAFARGGCYGDCSGSAGLFAVVLGIGAVLWIRSQPNLTTAFWTAVKNPLVQVFGGPFLLLILVGVIIEITK